MCHTLNFVSVKKLDYKLHEKRGTKYSMLHTCIPLLNYWITCRTCHKFEEKFMLINSCSDFEIGEAIVCSCFCDEL